MKIRADFVTNSSSSSFVRICIYDDELCKFMEKLRNENKVIKKGYDDLMNGKVCNYLNFSTFNYRGSWQKFVYADAPKHTVSSYKELIRSFFILSDEDLSRLNELLDKVFDKEDKYLTDIFQDYTDGYSGNSKLFKPTVDLFKRVYGTDENKFVVIKNKLFNNYWLEYYNGLDKNVEIPKTVMQTIVKGSLNSANKEYIKIPIEVKRIGAMAFVDSKEMETISIPSQVTCIKAEAFRGCVNLKKIIIDPQNPIYTSGENNDCIIEKETGTLLLATNTTIPEGIKKIGEFAFFNLPYDEVKKLKISSAIGKPEKIFNLNDGFFDSEKSDFSTKEEIREFETENGIVHDSLFVNDEINENIIYVDGEYVRANEIEEIVFPKQVDTIFTMYNEYISLEGVTIYYNFRMESVKSITWPKAIKFNPAEEATVTGSYSESGASSVYQHKGPNLRDCFMNLECVTFYAEMEEIPKEAFCELENLKTVVLPESLKFIRGRAFVSTALENITIPSKVELIGKRAFLNCKNLKKVIVEDGAKGFDKSAFEGCDNLTIYGSPKSYAEKFATRNNIPFMAID